MSELEIPDAAYASADAVLGNEHDMINAAAPLIVAAYLQRIIVRLQCTEDQDIILDLASELDPKDLIHR
jgi:hypothetical protein